MANGKNISFLDKTLNSMDMTRGDAKMVGLGITQGLAQASAMRSNSRWDSINAEFEHQQELARATGQNTALEQTEKAVNAAALTRTMGTQIEQMQAEGAMRVAQAAKGVGGTSMKDISASLELAKNSRIQQILTETAQTRQNIYKQQQSIDHQMNLSKITHEHNQKVRKGNRKYSGFISAVTGGINAYAGTLGS